MDHVTSPMSNYNDYIDTIKKFIFYSTKKNYDSLLTVDKNNQYLINSKNKWLSHNPKIKKWPRTQIYVISITLIVRHLFQQENYT